MDAKKCFSFKITAYTPKTIPLDRLAKYMSELASLMGQKEHIIFGGVKRGSTVICARVEPEKIDVVENRLNEASSASAPTDVARSFKKLNELLREDNARGTLKRPGGAKIIKFPGRDMTVSQRIGPIHQETTVDGILISVGGKDNTIHAHILGAHDQGYNLVTNSRDVAKQLASHLFSPVRVTGNGTWCRNEEGLWELTILKIQEFEPLGERTLGEAILELRAVEGGEWQKMNDPLATWHNLRGN